MVHFRLNRIFSIRGSTLLYNSVWSVRDFDFFLHLPVFRPFKYLSTLE